MDRNRRTTAWPPVLAFIALGGFLCGYVKHQVYNQTANMLDEFEAQINAAIANVQRHFTVRLA
jgi:hypothetical protein